MTTSPTSEIKLSIEESFDLTSALAKVRSAHAPAFSPAGNQIAFLSNLTGLPQIWVISFNGGMPHMITALDEPITCFRWSPNGQQIAFELSPGGSSRTQLFLINTDGTNLRRLSHNTESTHQLGIWHPLGQKLSFSSNHETPAHLHTYWLDIQSGVCERITTNKGIGHLTDLDADQNLALLYRMDDRTDSNIYLLDLDKNTERSLTPHLPPSKYQHAQFGQDFVYLISDEGREFPAFARLNQDTAKLTFVAERENATLVEFVLNPAKDTAFLLWQTAEGMVLTQWTEAIQNSRTLRAFPPQTEISELTISPDSKSVAFSLSHPQAPKEVFLLDVESAESHQLTFSPHAGVRFDELIAPEEIFFPANDGLALQGWLYLPENFAKPGAAVVSFHGGPEAREGTAFNPLYQALLAQGVVIFAPNVRGSAGFGKSYEHADNGRLREDAFADVAACTDFLVQEGIADPQLIGVMGDSYGGYLTLVSFTHFADLFAAGVVCSGFSDFETFFANTEAWIAKISKTIYGDPEKDAALLREISPIHKLNALKAPLLIFHGENDTNVHVSEAEQVAMVLNEPNKVSSYYLVDGEGHDFQRLRTRVAQNHAIASFFAKHLLGN